jgi:pimeloyl-ACP methyl ester carboxylesterase
MGSTIVFIHGAWMTPLCWEKFSGFFEGKGFKCLAPAWPYKDQSVEALRQHPAPELATLGIADIVSHYEQQIRALDQPPILIGHSFGGLFVQMLLDRGLGAAGAALDPAPPKGVLPFYPSAIKANLPVLTTVGGWRKILHMSFPAFQYAFVNSLPETEQRAAYDRYVVPESGRIFFQAATAEFHNTTRVNFENRQRSPLLLIAGAADNICPAAQIRNNHKKYEKSSAVTDFKEFEGRTHWLIAQEGWQEVAEHILNWLAQVQT